MKLALEIAAATMDSQAMTATAIVQGRVRRFRLSPALARAQRLNSGKTMSDGQAVAFVETRRRRQALRAAAPYLETRS